MFNAVDDDDIHARMFPANRMTPIFAPPSNWTKTRSITSRASAWRAAPSGPTTWSCAAAAKCRTLPTIRTGNQTKIARQPSYISTLFATSWNSTASFFRRAIANCKTGTAEVTVIVARTLRHCLHGRATLPHSRSHLKWVFASAATGIKRVCSTSSCRFTTLNNSRARFSTFPEWTSKSPANRKTFVHLILISTYYHLNISFSISFVTSPVPYRYEKY